MGIPWDGIGMNWYGMGQKDMSNGLACEFVTIALFTD